MIHYLNTESIRVENLASRILQEAPKYIILQGLLYKLRPKSKKSHFQRQAMLYVPKSMQLELIHWQHAKQNNSHLGEQKTLLTLKELFFWPGMDKQVREVIGSCDTCLTSKRNQKVINPQLNLFDNTTRPFERVVIDLLGPLPLTSR